MTPTSRRRNGYLLLAGVVLTLLGTYRDPGKTRAQPAAATAPAAPSVINVRDLGAVGDGVADDTSSIQRALDKVGISGGVVLFPPGKYRVASRHRLYGKDTALMLSAPVPPPLPIKLLGDAATLIHDAGDVKLLYIGDTARPYMIDGFEMTGFRIVGTRTGRRNDDIAQFNNTLLYLNIVSNARVHHNQFERCTGAGVYFAQTRSTVIDHNQFVNANGGLQGTGSRDVLIDGNVFTCSVKCDDQIGIFGDAKHKSENVKIANNIVDKGYDGRRGVAATAAGAKETAPAARGWGRCVAVGAYCENVDIAGNTLANCNSSAKEDRDVQLGLGAIVLEAGPDVLRDVQIRGNTMSNCRWAIHATGGVDGLSVSDNTIRDMEDDVFRAGPSQDVYSFSSLQFTGNRIRNCGKKGGDLMVFYMTDGLQIDRNTFSDCSASRVIALADAAGKVTGHKSVFVRDNIVEKLSEETEGTIVLYQTIHDRLVITGNHVNAKRKTHVHGYNLRPGAQVVIEGNTFEGWTQSPVFTEGWTGTPAGGGGNYFRPDGAAWEGRWAAPIRLVNGWGADGRATALAAGPPKSGPWQAGDLVSNSALSPGGASGWYCAKSGSPGTWLPIGQLTAPEQAPR